MTAEASEAFGIDHLDFMVLCNCQVRETIRGPKLFGLIPKKMGPFKNCGAVARYSCVSRCCGISSYLCRRHRIGQYAFFCKKCRKTFDSVDSGLVIYAF
jgi:hypothetical protein